MSEIEVTKSSGNVFADLGLANPEEELAKAELGHAIRQTIKARGLTQKAAAELMGETQGNVSMIVGGKLARFSLERLMRLARALGKNVTITLSDAPAEERGRLELAGSGR